MYFLYVDESGDDGLGYGKKGQKSPVDYYILTGLVVPVVNWNEVFSKVKDYRRDIKRRYGLKLREELHGSDIVQGRGILYGSGLTQKQRISLYEDALIFISQVPNIKIINVLIKKVDVQKKKKGGQIPEFFRVKNYAWRLLIQRFHNYLENVESDNSKRFGLVIADENNRKTVVNEIRKMRVYNPVPSRFGGFRNLIISTIIEDPSFRKSDFSYFIQFVDLVAFALGKRDFPTQKSRKLGLDRLFEILDPILLKEASTKNRFGIVYYP